MMNILFSRENFKSFLAVLVLVVVMAISYFQIIEHKVFKPFDEKLQSSNGSTTLNQLMNGKITLLYFGFLACPDACPTTLSKMTSVFKSFDDSKMSKINFLFVGLDPERDNIEKMQKYTDHFHPQIVPVILSPERLNLFTKFFGIVHMKVPLKSKMGYTIDHSTHIVVLSPKGEFQNPILHDDNKTQIMASLNQLLKEQFNK